MGKIAYLITGMTPKEMWKYNFKPVNSIKDIQGDQNYIFKNFSTYNDRVRARKHTVKHMPECLKLTLVERIKSLF